MSDSPIMPQEEIMDDTILLDFDQLDEEEERLDNMPRGLEAALERSQRSRSVGMRTRSLDSPELEEIEMGDVGEMMIVDEDWGGEGEAFSVVEVSSDAFLVEVSNANAFFITDNKKELDLSAIVQEPLPTNEYYPENTDKHQIYLHHTVSPGDPMISINWWQKDRSRRGNRIRVATFVVIAGREKSRGKYKDGEIYQCYSSRHWAHHLGVSGSGNRGRIASKYHTQSHNVMLNKQSLGIELSSWGPLHPMQNGNFAPWDHYRSVMKKHGTESKIKRQIPSSLVIEYPDTYRGFRYFERYTDAQIESTRQMLVYLCDKYNIPRKVDASIFGLNEPALRGDPGIYTHTSVRADKSDCHPQPELLEMLKNL